MDLAAVYKCIIATGRSPGDNGQPTCLKENSSSRPDHILLLPKLFAAVHNTRIDKNERPDQCDHCAILCQNFRGSLMILSKHVFLGEGYLSLNR